MTTRKRIKQASPKIAVADTAQQKITRRAKHRQSKPAMPKSRAGQPVDGNIMTNKLPATIASQWRKTRSDSDWWNR